MGLKRSKNLHQDQVSDLILTLRSYLIVATYFMKIVWRNGIASLVRFAEQKFQSIERVY